MRKMNPYPRLDYGEQCVEELSLPIEAGATQIVVRLFLPKDLHGDVTASFALQSGATGMA